MTEDEIVSEFQKMGDSFAALMTESIKFRTGKDYRAEYVIEPMKLVPAGSDYEYLLEDVSGHAMWHSYVHADGRTCSYHHRLDSWVMGFTRKCLRTHAPYSDRLFVKCPDCDSDSYGRYDCPKCGHNFNKEEA